MQLDSLGMRLDSLGMRLDSLGMRLDSLGMRLVNEVFALCQSGLSPSSLFPA